MSSTVPGSPNILACTEVLEPTPIPFTDEKVPVINVMPVIDNPVVVNPSSNALALAAVELVRNTVGGSANEINVNAITGSLPIGEVALIKPIINSLDLVEELHVYATANDRALEAALGTLNIEEETDLGTMTIITAKDPLVEAATVLKYGYRKIEAISGLIPLYVDMMHALRTVAQARSGNSGSFNPDDFVLSALPVSVVNPNRLPVSDSCAKFMPLILDGFVDVSWIVHEDWYRPGSHSFLPLENEQGDNPDNPDNPFEKLMEGKLDMEVRVEVLPLLNANPHMREDVDTMKALEAYFGSVPAGSKNKKRKGAKFESDSFLLRLTSDDMVRGWEAYVKEQGEETTFEWQTLKGTERQKALAKAGNEILQFVIFSRVF